MLLHICDGKILLLSMPLQATGASQGHRGKKEENLVRRKKWTWKECVFDRAAVSRIEENRLLENGKKNLRSLQTSPQATTLNLWGHGRKYTQIHFNLRRCWPIFFKVNYHSLSESDKSIFWKKLAVLSLKYFNLTNLGHCLYPVKNLGQTQRQLPTDF